jgi:lipopolysaccharide/colanic/teichoic acid biosynthesis glycosyltransferase
VRRGKRLFDLLASGLGLGLLWPGFILIAALIWLEDGHAPFFVQERVGRDGVPFRMWKFRTMRPSTGGRLITVAGDARITRVGRFLRRTKLDELPQLWNVFRGDMSLVGPRPEVRCYVDRYTAEQRRLLALTPGITDPASLALIDEEAILAGEPDPERAYVERIVPSKMRLNLDYAGRATMASDAMTILRTLAALGRSRKQGATIP